MVGADVQKLRELYLLLLAMNAGMSRADTKRYVEFTKVVRTWSEQSTEIDLGKLASVIEQNGLLDIWEKVHTSPVLVGANQYQNEIFLDQVKVASIQRYGKPLIPLFAGEFPTSELNGCILKVDEGALILINSGLPFLLNHLSNLLAGFAIPNTFKGHAFETNGRDTRSRKVTVVAIANALTWYLLLGMRTKLRELPVPGEFQYHVTTLVRQETLKFVIAHEVAHATLGHIDLNETSPAFEFDADREAIHILRSQSISHELKEAQELHSEAQLAGPIFFLSVCTLIDAALSRASIRVLSEKVRLADGLPGGFRYARAEQIGVTHPPSAERLRVMWEVIASEQATFDIAKAYSNSLNELQPEILDVVEAFCNRNLRP
jgi:hypothetical protein